MPPIHRLLALGVAAAIAAPVQAQPLAPADPLTVTVQTEDAERFARLFARTGGKPTAEQLQREYLDPGSAGIKIFTPNRIVNAQALAGYIAKHPEKYHVAIERCLPVVKEANAELRAIYLALRGLYPDRPLPQIFVVFGGGNSGGTAGPGAQVLGLEVMCEISPTTDALRQRLRIMFAHETAHSWQPSVDGTEKSVLLRAVLTEGAADYIAWLVLGGPPSPEREAWASAREAELWKQFMSDVAQTRDVSYNDPKPNKPARAALLRWVSNYGKAPEGWPYEMGYWIGMRIWQRYVDQAADKRATIEHVLVWTDPEAVLAKGAYQP